MKDDSSLIFAFIGLIAIYFLYRTQLNNQALQQQAMNNQQANLNNPWLTVPGAVNVGLQGVGSLMSTFNNLFTDNPTSDPDNEIYGDAYWTQ